MISIYIYIHIHNVNIYIYIYTYKNIDMCIYIYICIYVLDAAGDLTVALASSWGGYAPPNFPSWPPPASQVQLTYLRLTTYDCNEKASCYGIRCSRAFRLHVIRIWLDNVVFCFLNLRIGVVPSLTGSLQIRVGPSLTSSLRIKVEPCLTSSLRIRVGPSLLSNLRISIGPSLSQVVSG